SVYIVMMVAARLILSSPPPKALAMCGETKLDSTPLPVMKISTPRKPQRSAWGKPSRSRKVSCAEPAAGTAEPSEVVEDAVLMALLCAGEEVGRAAPPGSAQGPTGSAAAAGRAGQRPGTIETLTEEPAASATAASAFWKSARPNWWVHRSSSGRVPFSMILMAPGQVCGPRWAPRTSSSLSSEMIDQSTETFSLNTEYSTKRPSLRSRFRPCGTALGWPVHSMYTSAP